MRILAFEIWRAYIYIYIFFWGGGGGLLSEFYGIFLTALAAVPHNKHS